MPSSAHSQTWGPNIPLPGTPTVSGSLINLAAFNSGYTWYPSTSVNYLNPSTGLGSIPIAPPGTNGAVTSNGAPGDWDNGISNYPDGPWINKADEGSLPPTGAVGEFIPYFYAGHGAHPVGPAFFSPNRQVPSPGMFGSLPTGIDPSGKNSPKPWQTLLFRPGTSGATGTMYGYNSSGYPAHPGEANYSGITGLPEAEAPPDHLLLDLFWMPVAEPYAISDPFSTAGKVNLNYQIMPYAYITRSTALRAALATEMVADNLPPTQSGAQNYKYNLNFVINNDIAVTRAPINLDLVIQQFEAKFRTGDIFHSASDICDIFLIPNDGVNNYPLNLFPKIWYNTKINVNGAPIDENFTMAGDNTRERPYTNIYGKITTKSNTYQVHYRVQTLQKVKYSDQTQWVEGQDQVTGEKRGSTIIERYLDPTATTIPDFASMVYQNPGAAPDTMSLETNYKFRVVNTALFHP